jgi:hypothetical protein
VLIDHDIGASDRAGPNVDAELGEHDPLFPVEARTKQREQIATIKRCCIVAPVIIMTRPPASS